MLDPPPYFLTHLNVKEPAMIARARACALWNII